MAIWVIVPAAGIGTRMSSAIPKQYLHIDGTSVLLHSVRALCRVPNIDTVMVALSPQDELAAQQGLSNGATINGCKVLTCEGGQTRAQSVLNALLALASMASVDDWVLVHDAARPCVREKEIIQLIETAQRGDIGALLAVPVRGTLKKGNESSLVVETVDRNQMWEAATPQIFPFGLLKDAITQAMAKGGEITDEASAIEAFGYAPTLVPCSADNIKITYPQDLLLASLIMQAHSDENQEGPHV